jgi:hypothetical protein
MSARRLILPVLVTALGALALTAAPALAAFPGVLGQSVPSVTPFEAHLEATVNAGEEPAGETTECHFEYGEAVITEHKVPCEQGTLPGSLEGGEQGVSANATGLTPKTLYHYRIVLKNATGEAKGTSEFTTLTLEAPIVEGESAPAPKAAEARLEAVVNANYQEVTQCEFQYGTSPSLATSATAGCEPATLEGLFGGQGVGASVSGLTPETIYYYRVVATNATGPVEGTIEHFTTGPPAKPELLKAEPITGTTATLSGVLNPKQEGNPGSYEFLYRQSRSECQGGTPEEDKLTPTQGAAGSIGEAATAEVTGLLPKLQYTFCLLARNEAGETTVSAPVTFETGVVAPEQIEAANAEAATTTSVEFASEFNPGGEATYYFEYGTAPCTPAACGEKSAALLAHGITEQSLPPIGVSGLAPGTIYHYWLVVTNASGTIHSSPSQFRTAETPAEAEAEAAAERKPAEEGAAAAAAVSRREAEAASGQAAAAAAAAGEKKKYEELAAETTALLTPKLASTTAPPKATAPKVVRCKKGFAKKHKRCVKTRKKGAAR